LLTSSASNLDVAGWIEALLGADLLVSAHVTEHRVWHLESLRHGGFSEPGHQGWHVLGKMVGT